MGKRAAQVAQLVFIFPPGSQRRVPTQTQHPTVPGYNTPATDETELLTGSFQALFE